MATSSLNASGCPRPSAEACSRDKRRTGRLLGPGLSATILVLTLLAATSAQCLELAGGVAIPRGFYDYALSGFGEFRLYKGTLPPFLSVNGRVSGYGSYRDQIGLAVGSASVLVKVTTPKAVGGTLGIRPYVAAGPSLNYQYSWADLGDFGTISESKSSATTSVFVGADLFTISTSRLSLFVEARETLGSDFTFDYVLIGLKFAGPTLPEIE